MIHMLEKYQVTKLSQSLLMFYVINLEQMNQSILKDNKCRKFPKSEYDHKQIYIQNIFKCYIFFSVN